MVTVGSFLLIYGLPDPFELDGHKTFLHSFLFDATTALVFSKINLDVRLTDAGNPAATVHFSLVWSREIQNLIWTLESHL